MAKQSPKFRLSISNKDKSEREFTDYKGDEVSKKYQGIGAIFHNADEDRWFVASDTAFKFDPEKHWLNVFPVDQDDDKPASKKQGGGKGKPAKKVKKAPPPPEDDEDEDDSNPFEDD